MKPKLLFIILLISSCVFAQQEIYFYKDTTSNLTFQEAKSTPFQLLENQILEPYSDDVYWFKIPKHKTEVDYIFRLLYERIHNAKVYQGLKKLDALKSQRFLSYKFSRKDDVYIRVNPKLHAYIPVELLPAEKSYLKENRYLLFNGFYYGFAFLVIIYNIFYFFLFKDDAFLYYSLFLASMVFGVFTMDGMLNFYEVDEHTNNLLMIVNYFLLSFFSSKFANSYLFLDNYYPKLKKISYSLGIIIIILGIHYLFYGSYYSLLFLNILVFSLLIIYWFCSVLLFKKNVYTKILAIAYVIILFSAIDFFILKFSGISIINIDATNIKVGAFLEMIILSIAVLYRMKTLKEENNLMRKEIVMYSEQLVHLEKTQTEKEKNNLEKLSSREKEIFDLIVLGKSNKEIGMELNISVNTVKFHLKNVYEKLNIKNRREALNY